jgi:hypothetical protein
MEFLEISKEVEEYAKKMDELGDRLNGIGTFVPMPLDTEEKIKKHFVVSAKAISDFREVELRLSLSLVPKELKSEHDELIKIIQLYITGTKLQYDAINTNKDKKHRFYEKLPSVDNIDVLRKKLNPFVFP